MKITLADKGDKIPRNKMGDPAFTHLGNSLPLSNQVELPNPGAVAAANPTILSVFTPTEVVELVNRCLYQLEYQARSHTKRAAQQRALEQPVKEMLKRLYPGTSFAKATPEQLAHCLRELNVVE